MTTSISISSLALSIALAACGGSSEPAPAAPTTEATAAAPAPTADPHADLPAPVVAFHDVLKPLWHDASPERQARTCGQVGELKAKGAELGGVTVPPERAEPYAGAVAHLVGAIGELEAACGGTGDFTASFTKVHEGFHAVAEAAGGMKHAEHEKHGEHHAE